MIVFTTGNDINWDKDNIQHYQREGIRVMISRHKY